MGAHSGHKTALDITSSNATGDKLVKMVTFFEYSNCVIP